MTDYQEDQLRRLSEVTTRLAQDGHMPGLCVVARMGVSLDETPPVWLELQELGLVKVWRNDGPPSFIYVAPVE